jgi:predicted ATPase/signal transduction histidine kinase
MEFAISETLRQRGCAAVYRALRPSDHSSVVLKVVDPRRCRPGDLERLRREYELGASLEGPRFVRSLAFDTYEGMPSVVLEDSGGQPLERLLAAPMPVEEFLELAVGMANAVAELHRQGVIHKDLKPENVLVDPATKQVKLADFGIATRLPREQQAARPPQLIEGTLPYMSPEQTGRMNRALDSRSDLYSLGVTFYRMLTGRLPFEARDPLEWVHHHLARPPAPPSQLIPGVPEAVSRLVMKLLAKMAEDRYQSARGLEHDLTRCLEQWRRGGRIDPFTLGERDVPDRLQIPQKLYGREEQIAALLGAFQRVVETGAPGLVLVSGHPGIGKSSVVHELEKPITGRRGLFAEGKFDQYRRDIPYSTIAHAFGDLALDLLAEGEDHVTAWRERLETALGVNGQLIVDVIPQVQLLVGNQAPVPELPLSEAKNRFHMVFRKFLGAFAREEHPLVLFLDDLQWADSASLELLAEVLTHPETRHLLAVGAYRDNEVSAGHPLMMALDEVRRAPLEVREVDLAPLSREHLCQLVTDAMRCPAEEALPLAALLLEKTAGNPFFAIQFLAKLDEDGLIRLHPDALAWRCDIDSARARGYTDNVVELMVGKLRRLPAAQQEVVKLAACVGNVTDVQTLAALRERTEEETHRDLWELVRQDLLHRSGEVYAFSHDRVEQAAYALIPEEKRSEAHLRVGRILLAHTPPELSSARAFDVVNQLNRGASLMDSAEERTRLARLDLLAGKRAQAGAAYGPAASYLAAGMALLPADAWQTQYELAYSLHLARAECEHLAGNFSEAARCLGQALLHARTRAEKAAIYRLRGEVHTTRGEPEAAVDAAIECAALFGLALERHPPPESVEENYARVQRSLGGRSIEALVELPPMSDPDVRALAEALVAVIPAAFQYDTRLDFAIVSEAVRLSIEHGNAPCSVVPYGGFGILVGPMLGHTREGYRFAKLGHELAERHGLVAYKAASSIAFGYMASFWTRHVGTGLPLLEEGLRAGAATGALNMSGYICDCIVAVLLARGDALGEVERQSARMLGFLRSARYWEMEDLVLIQRRLVHRLRGRAPETGGAEDEGLDTRIRGRIPIETFDYHVRRLQERFLFGDFPEALSAATEAKDLLWTSISRWERCEHSFFHALTLAALYPQTSPGEREEVLRTIRDEVERHRTWAENCPENFLDRHALVSAELARVEGRELDAERHYEQAIRSARENGFVQNEALAYEVASRFYRARALDVFADSYLREARACYLRWGADAKVTQIDELHPQLLEARPSAPTATFAARTEQLDLFSVVKASQTISGEMEIERLVGTLLQVALEQGGARRGLLILAREGALSIEAEASMEEQGVVTRILPSLALEPSGLVPLSVVHYARLTSEPVIIEDAATAAGKFAPEQYFSRRRTRSILCLPIRRQAELIGFLYLENRFVAGAFTPDRLTALSLLASQAAISVENARLLLEERQARQRSAFLAEAGVLLFSESLDYEQTLTRLGSLCVKSLADWCVLDLVEAGELRRLAGACADPAREPLLEQLRQRYPARWDSPHPSARSLRAGEPLLIPAFTDELLRSMCEDEVHLGIIRGLGTQSAVVVPLVARGQALGVLTLASATPGRYGRADLELAKEVAHRAALAIDNARLYGETQRAVQMRDEFLQVASHELRTPVAGLTLSVTGLLRALRSPGGVAPERMGKLLELADRQGARLTRLLEDVMDVSKAEAGWAALHLEEVELGALVRDVVARFEADLTRAGCSLSIRCDGTVFGLWDRSRVDQVIANLVSNAVKFGAGKPIEVQVGEAAGLARLSVRDQGIGIDVSQQARVFDRFQRAVSAMHYGGLGLGLFISRRIVEAHGGTIRVESAPGEGSTFTVELPSIRSEGAG